jgi:hypothetical protein
MLASEPFLAEARGRAELVVEGEPEPLQFDARGDLVPVF